MEEKNMHFIMLNNKIYRNTQMYLDRVLKKYDLTNGIFPYLFVLLRNEGINQNRISEEVGNDKAMSARTITKLIELGYVYKEQDKSDNRAYKLYLTEKGKDIIPIINKEVQILLKLITEGLSGEENNVMTDALKKIFHKTQKLKDAGGI